MRDVVENQPENVEDNAKILEILKWLFNCIDTARDNYQRDLERIKKVISNADSAGWARARKEIVQEMVGKAQQIEAEQG